MRARLPHAAVSAVARRVLARLAPVLLALAALAPASSGQELTSADLFDDGVVHELRLFIHGDDWSLLRTHYLENTYYPVDVHWRDVVVRNAGIRSRGSGSRDPGKPSLKIDFRHYVADQALVGLTSLDLDNFRQDAGMMKELVSMQFFRRMGQAAPRAAHARVYVNNEYLGLYAMLEPIDKRFLDRALDENDGYLYEYEWAGGLCFEWLGGDLSRYAALFKPKTHESDAPEQLYGPIEAMISAVNHTGRSSWESVVSGFLDLELLLSYLAVETFLSDHDGLAGDWGLNNFYVYRFEDGGRFQWIPWDKDVNFREIDRGIFEGVDQNVLIATALQFPRLRDAYLSALRRCAAIAAEPEPDGRGPGWLEREIGREANLIRPAAYEDRRKAYTNERFEQEAAWMLQFARQRGGHVLRHVEEAARSR